MVNPNVAITSHTCDSLNLDTLDASMGISLNDLRIEFIDWNDTFDTWKIGRVTNKSTALSLLEVELDG